MRDFDMEEKWIYNSSVYIREGVSMQVSKWGNSLAVRLPAALVKELGLKEGDEVELRVATDRQLEVTRDAEELRERERRQKAIERIRELRVTTPDDFQFDRSEIYDR